MIDEAAFNASLREAIIEALISLENRLAKIEAAIELLNGEQRPFEPLG